MPILKRAQLTAADLALALGRSPLGRFDDLDRLAVFADNLVPHVLRVEGVLVYDPELLERISAGELLQPGEEAEVEIEPWPSTPSNDWSHCSTAPAPGRRPQTSTTCSGRAASTLATRPYPVTGRAASTTDGRTLSGTIP